MANRKFGALSSSTNPEELAATVSGAILTFSSLIIFTLGQIGVPVTDTQIAHAAAQIGAAVGGVWFTFGLVRKAIVRFTKNESN